MHTAQKEGPTRAAVHAVGALWVQGDVAARLHDLPLVVLAQQARRAGAPRRSIKRLPSAL